MEVSPYAAILTKYMCLTCTLPLQCLEFLLLALGFCGIEEFIGEDIVSIQCSTLKEVFAILIIQGS